MTSEIKIDEVSKTNIEDLDNDEALLRASQKLRLESINKLLSGSDSITSSTDNDHILLKLIAGVDSQVIAKKRIAAAEKGNEVNGDIANALNKLVLNAGIRTVRHDTPTDNEYKPEIPSISDIDVIEGECAPIGTEIDFNEIMSNEIAKFKN